MRAPAGTPNGRLQAWHIARTTPGGSDGCLTTGGACGMTAVTPPAAGGGGGGASSSSSSVMPFAASA